jgi:hypothetical protein
MKEPPYFTRSLSKVAEAIRASGAVPLKNRLVPLKAHNLELWTTAPLEREDR